MDRLDPIEQVQREPRSLSPEAVTKILQAIPPSNLRDRALFTLLYETGIRVGEALSLLATEVDLSTDDEKIRVFGKGQRERTVMLTAAPAEGEKGFLLARHSDCLLYANTFTPDTRWRSRVAMPFAQREVSETPDEFLRCTDTLFALMVKQSMQENISPRFLFWALQDPPVTTRLTGGDQFKGSVKISRAKLRSLAVPVPLLDEQERISAYLDAYQKQLSQLQQTQRANQLTVDQLEGRILDQFFREDYV